ncbi:MAG: hypothetical protein Q4C61_14015 [Lachnospiraceae bacterium]|nr:hypothetical protein [Lachnospiraceae bacterium]
MSDDSWTQNPALGGIDPAKLQMLLSMADQAKGKSPAELLPFLMAASSQSKENNMSFNSSETDAIIEVMKMGKSKEEIQKIDRICAIMKQIKK